VNTKVISRVLCKVETSDYRRWIDLLSGGKESGGELPGGCLFQNSRRGRAKTNSSETKTGRKGDILQSWRGAKTRGKGKDRLAPIKGAKPATEEKSRESVKISPGRKGEIPQPGKGLKDEGKPKILGPLLSGLTVAAMGKIGKLVRHAE